MTALDSRPAPAAPPDERVVTPAVTVIVPTRNEKGNVAALLARLVPALPAGSEVLFVDDSDDGTQAAIEASACGHSVPVRTHHREPGERSGGLGGAVADGLRLASRDWCVVMDADLQHPPELVPELVRAGQARHSQLVVASRYDGGGDAESFNRSRAVMSTWATHLAKAFFPHRLAAISDPMSGFFAVRRDAVDPETLRPNGFKILLEIAVRCGPLRTSEVSFHFGRRFAGESKASLREGARLVALLTRLWFDVRGESRSARVAAFAAVGATGLLVNTVALWVATGIAGLHYALGAVVATVVSTTWNWAVLESLVYPGSATRSTGRRFVAFGALNGVALALRIPLIALLVENVGVNYLLANLISLIALFAARFVVTDTMIFRRPVMTALDHAGGTGPAPSAPAAVTQADAGQPGVAPSDGAHPNGAHPNGSHPNGTQPNGAHLNGAHLNGAHLNGTHLNGAQPSAPGAAGVTTQGPAAVDRPRRVHEGYLKYRYAVPGVATIGSQVPLPELQWFLTPFVTRGPFDIEIRVAPVGRMRGHVRFTAADDDERTYEEHLGAFSANFRIEMGDTIHITAGPLLEHSPHVLYTNIIEALLRFLAVARGRLLLHSACVRLGDTGVMLSARTDTGKTGTILRLIREEGATFLSDDMTIVEPSGLAHCFPKPLTISHHTLRAVNASGLSRTEWGKLRVQSRLHSKEGRQFGMRLARMNLPIMTFNALTQAVVPPPKYDVDRLVPCDVIHEVDVTKLFIIERGPNGVEDVAAAAGARRAHRQHRRRLRVPSLLHPRPDPPRRWHGLHRPSGQGARAAGTDARPPLGAAPGARRLRVAGRDQRDPGRGPRR